MKLRKFSALTATIAMVAAGVSLTTAPAQALPDQALPGKPSSMWQTNARVLTMEYRDGVLYAGGEFTAVRPPGAAAGTNQTTRNRLVALNATTGAPTSLNVDFNGIVRSVSVSPDGDTLYAVGGFTTVNGQARGRGAAINLNTGALLPWNPRLGSMAWAVDATDTAVYIGGTFGRANNVIRERLAAFSPAGALLPWAPTADGYVRTLRVSPAGDRVIVGGGFNTLNGETMRALGSVDPVTGENETFPNGIIPTVPGAPTSGGCCYTEASGLSDDGQYMYVAAEGTGGGIFDGSVKFDPSDGTIVWRETCLGATQFVQPLNGSVYKASHAHSCSSLPGGFSDGEAPTGGYHLLALDRGTGGLQHWFPAMNGGPGGGLGPRVFATDGTQLFVGGEFTTVDNRAQQGLTRFTPGTPGAGPKRPDAPFAAVRSNGQLTVSLPATSDIDSGTLTYELFRNSTNGSPIATLERESTPWRAPTVTFNDPDLPAGQSASYLVRVTDGTTSVTSPRSNTVVGGQAPSTYPDGVRADGASLYWRLADGGSTTAADSSGNGRAGSYSGGASSGVAGVLDGNGAASFDGVDGLVSTQAQEDNPQSFSVEAWVRTTSKRGGKVVGFGNAATGLSSNYDRHIYLTNTGQAVFGIWDGSARTIQSSKRVNDGQWHHLVGTLGPDGLAFYVDGQRVGTVPTATVAQPYSGYWRVGGDNLGGWPSEPASRYLQGDIDEVAVYPAALSGELVAAHYTLSGYELTPPPPPPTSCPTGEFLATYWNSTALEGDPALVRCESTIDNDWGDGSPAEEVTNDQFSARWTQTQTLSAGTYRITTTSDDGIRVKIDGTVVLENWTDHGPTVDTVEVPLTAGSHDIVVEYYESGGGAVARFEMAAPTAPPTSCPAGEYLATYWSSMSLSGDPALVRCETSIDHDWGEGSPAASIPNDGFSARWTQTPTLSAGTYRITTTSDDGIRVKVDGTVVLENWSDHAPVTDTVDVSLSEGAHDIVVEYYENGGGAVARFNLAPAP